MDIFRSNVMQQIVNQYSYILVSIILLLLLAGLLAWRKKGFHWREAGFVLVLAALLAAGWFSLRPDKTTATTSDLIRAQIGKGKPVLLEFQSPY